MKEDVLLRKHGQKGSLPTSPRSEADPLPKGCETACESSGWTEKRIAYALAAHYFKSRSILYVPNCNWTQSEADILVVEMSRKLIDVEIKISRPDLKNDVHKRKWWHEVKVKTDGVWTSQKAERKDWPDKVWKHIYVMPQEEWKDDLFQYIPEKSGVVLIYGSYKRPFFYEVRRPAINKNAIVLTDRQVMDIARLANIRMWQTYHDIEKSPTWRL